MDLSYVGVGGQGIWALPVWGEGGAGGRGVLGRKRRVAGEAQEFVLSRKEGGFRLGELETW